jgi:glycosyltransferase involved in cell wall biosynthesis/GT2 family glycosyltransferase/tetratricopeptide (TPR) repeat protein/2-polyprenyl-3-methyl-5-hydroxy-6-metoxy-1,4-benzoquinol methylase
MLEPDTCLDVLVFNWHEPYIALFACTGHRFYVSPPAAAPQKGWNTAFRPLPANVTPIPWAEAQNRALIGGFDLALCLTLQDVQAVQGWPLPKLFCMLNMIGTDAGLSGPEKEAYVQRLKPLFTDVGISFISEKKRRDWNWDGPVVVSGIDPEQYGGYTGDEARILRVGNMLQERDRMQGYSVQREILGADLPSTILGVNPDIEVSRPSRDWEDLKNHYRTHRLLLSTLGDADEDGYNLAVLEAMASGMPVVATPNSSLPITDGHDGYVSDDPQVLRRRIRQLLADRDLAAELGANARRTVAERFHIRDCAAGWQRVFSACIQSYTGRHAMPAGKASDSGLKTSMLTSSAKTGQQKRILLLAPANPLSTSAYYERALRCGHEVLSCGPALDQEKLGQWKEWEDQHALKDRGAGDVDKMGLLSRLVRPCDLPMPWGRVRAADIKARLPAGWEPDLLLWIDAGADFLLEDPQDFDCPAVCLMGDTHSDIGWRLEYAKRFEHVFLMFVRQHLEVFRQSGCPRVDWLPAACEPKLFDLPPIGKAYDIVFAGQTLPQWHGERVRLLQRLEQAGFDLRVESKILEEMALLYARGRMVFNRSLNADLNMRVFEALASGSMLLTDRLPPESGLEELFVDGRDLVLYDDGDLEDKARYYLEHEAERQAIAASGRKLVLERHTYGHRADTLLEAVFGAATCASCLGGDGASTPVSGDVPPAAGAADQAPPAEAPLPDYYRNRRPEVAALVPDGARKVLELGCAAGEMGAALMAERPGLEVVGVEFNPEAADLARAKLSAVICADIEATEYLPFPAEEFDCIVCGDVLEHLRDPEAVLLRLLSYLKPGGALVCSIPNVRHQSVILGLVANGRWRYEDEGLLDRTHLRFFTLAEIREILDRLGLEVEELQASQSPPLQAMDKLCAAVGEMGGDAEGLKQESRVIQYIFRARKKAVVAEGKRVRVVIPVFNQAALTEGCLYAIADNTGTDPDYEVAVVDNGSSDWTRYLLHAFEGDVLVKENDENLGFARACNQGAEGAGAEYLLFLNNDTLPQKGWLEEMVRVADSAPDIGIVGAKLVYPESGLVQHAGIEMIEGIPEHVWRGVAADDPRVCQARDLDMVTGACLLIRRELFEALGGFDVSYLNGVEDVDLCLRVRQRGWRVVFCPHSIVGHFEGQSEGRFEKVRQNLQRFVEKWGGSFGTDGRLLLDGPEAGTTDRLTDGVTDKVPDKVSIDEETGGKRIGGEVDPIKGAPRALAGIWQGPFAAQSSLGHVNRELAAALLQVGVELGLEDSDAGAFKAEVAASSGQLSEVLAGQLGHRPRSPLFVVRHRWPPDFSVPAAGRQILFQPWEFGRVPAAWIEPISRQVDQVWAYTRYVRDCYIDSGVDPAKIEIVPLGIDPRRFRPDCSPLPLPTQKSFKFLFVGGTIHRKGIDLLLDAYCELFDAGDDVALVIKDTGANTFYRDQNAAERIKALVRQEGQPEIVYLDDDLPLDLMPGLYAACDCLVHPYRGEGFGLPVAEALACGLPVVLSRGGACDDFCRPEDVFFVETQRRAIQFQQETAGQAWSLEPDPADLRRQMQAVRADLPQARAKARRASLRLHKEFSWEASAIAAIRALQKLPPLPVVSEAILSAQDPQEAVVASVASAVDDAKDTLVLVCGGVPPAGYAHHQLGVDPEAGLGRRLEAERRQSVAELLVVLGRDVDIDVGILDELLDQMRQRPQLAFIGSADGAAAVMRRTPLEESGGFDDAFKTEAVLDNIARCLRRRGSQVGLAQKWIAKNGVADPTADRVWRQEQEAVKAMEEGDRLKGEGQLDQALVAYGRAIACKGEFVEAILVCADALLEAGRRQEAIEAMQRLVRLDAGSHRAHNYLGLVQYQGGDLSGARVSFERSLALEPAAAETLVNMGVVAWEEEEVQEALGFFEKAADIEPENRNLVMNLGAVYVQVGRQGAAEELLRGFLVSCPSDLDVQALLAEALKGGGKAAEAEFLARQVLKAAPQHQRALGVLGLGQEDGDGDGEEEK